MLSFKFLNTKVKISFSFFAVLALISLWENALAADLIIALTCCILHESGHLICMHAFSQTPSEIVLYGGGIKIKNISKKLVSSNAEIMILFAGCVVNIFVCCLAVLISKDFNRFSSANLFFGLFNLMPIKYFDGGRIISKIFNDSYAVKLIRLIFIIGFAFVIIIMIINQHFSLSFILTFIYIVISEFFT